VAAGFAGSGLNQVSGRKRKTTVCACRIRNSRFDDPNVRDVRTVNVRCDNCASHNGHQRSSVKDSLRVSPLPTSRRLPPGCDPKGGSADAGTHSRAAVGAITARRHGARLETPEATASGAVPRLRSCANHPKNASAKVGRCFSAPGCPRADRQDPTHQTLAGHRPRPQRHRYDDVPVRASRTSTPVSCIELLRQRQGSHSKKNLCSRRSDKATQQRCRSRPAGEPAGARASRRAVAGPWRACRKSSRTMAG
jgi:hypothetical protein